MDCSFGVPLKVAIGVLLWAIRDPKKGLGLGLRYWVQGLWVIVIRRRRVH